VTQGEGLRTRMWILRSDASSEAEVLTFRIRLGVIKTVGRSRGADFVVDAPLVSRVHCRLTADASGALLLEDLDSTNGTYLNGQRVRDKMRLKAGDRLGVGRVELVVERSE